jgi:drug/metabolite transporter (DMT)-like permease
MSTPLSSMAWIVGGGVIGSLGAVGLKAGAGRLKLDDLRTLFTNWRLACGILAYLISSVLFVKGLTHGQLSVLYPLVAMGQIWTLVWARVFFKEQITKHKLMAVGLILCGVALIGYGNSQLADKDEPVKASVSDSQTYN